MQTHSFTFDILNFVEVISCLILLFLSGRKQFARVSQSPLQSHHQRKKASGSLNKCREQKRNSMFWEWSKKGISRPIGLLIIAELFVVQGNFDIVV